ncbi:MAG: Bax inhibitor-1/YccA family protein [Alphaproteobacteria bacterium]|nr:Bax inhibitor-1/YccA family protein [Alphaproteobacteria bacterium]
MSDAYRTTIQTGTGTLDRAERFDAALRQHMLQVYNYMASGVLLSGIVAMLVASNQTAMAVIFGTPLKWVVMLAPLAFILVLSFGLHKLSDGATQALFWLFCAVMGLSMASIFVVFTGASIARVFFITAATFGAMSLYGYTTKRDLSGFGSFLLMGLIGLMIAGLVNIFLQSSMLQFAISAIGVLVFVGLTAYDTQRIKAEFLEGYEPEILHKAKIMGALSLYLNFVNIFMMLMNLFGQRDE